MTTFFQTCPLIALWMRVVALFMPLLVAVVWLTWAERRVIAAMQYRKGPNVAGPLGLLQPVADGVKVFLKEFVVPLKAHKPLFVLAPVFAFAVALTGWAVVPVAEGWVISDMNVGILFFLAISSLGVYGVLVAGWASNSKYAFLGGLRSAAQMIAYEVALGLSVVAVLLTAGTFNLSGIVHAQETMWFVWPHFPVFVVFFISILAETNRTPFDLPEAESELVGGYNVEYSGLLFSLFYLAEYANMILMSAMATVLFLGGWLPPVESGFPATLPGGVWFSLKTLICLFVFLWIRATFPRYRFDQLMRLGWKVFLPITLVWVMAMAGLLLVTDRLPGGVS